MSRRRWIILLAAVFLLVPSGMWLMTRTPWFRDAVRDRMRTELERITGGRVEIRRFDYHPATFAASVHDLIIHGTEGPGERPLLAIGTAEIRFSVRSLWSRDIELRGLLLDHPEINLILDKNGRLNLPGAKFEFDGRPLQLLLRLAIGEYLVRDGAIRYQDQHLAWDASGRGLEALLVLDRQKNVCHGDATVGSLDMELPNGSKMSAASKASFDILTDRIHVKQFDLSAGPSSARVAGDLMFRPTISAAGTFKSLLQTGQIASIFKVKTGLTGEASAEGSFHYAFPADYLVAADVSSNALQATMNGRRVTPIRGSAKVSANPSLVRVDHAHLILPQGEFNGSATVTNSRTLDVRGDLRAVKVQDVAVIGGVDLPYDASASGTIQVTTDLARIGDFHGQTKLRFEPLDGKLPVAGEIDAGFGSRLQDLDLRNLQLRLPGLEASAHGVMNGPIQLDAEVRSLDSLRPLAPWTSVDMDKLGVRFHPDGLAHFTGHVTGLPNKPSIDGDLSLRAVSLNDQTVDLASGHILASNSGLRLDRFDAKAYGTGVKGSVFVGLRDWRLADDATFNADFDYQVPDVALTLQALKQDQPLAGALQGHLSATGRLDEPSLTSTIRWMKGRWQSQAIPTLNARVAYRANTLQIDTDPTAYAGGLVSVNGTYHHDAKVYDHGQLNLSATLRQLQMADVDQVKQAKRDVSGLASGQVKLVAQVIGNQLAISAIDGKLTADGLRMNKQALGDGRLELATKGGQTNIDLAADITGLAMRGTGHIALQDPYPLSLDVSMANANFRSITNLIHLVNPEADLPVEGTFLASAALHGPLLDPAQWKTDLTVNDLKLGPKAEQMPTKLASDFVLRNEGPIEVSLQGAKVQVSHFRLAGAQTHLSMQGTLDFSDKPQSNLQLDGTLDLAQIRTLYPEVIASGSSKMNAVIKGSVDQPSVQGRLEFSKAAFSFPDFPNGIDNANGVIAFDRNRANIESMTGETGGGKIEVGGFVGFGSKLVYRLQATARQIRVRRDAVSVTGNAAITLSGTSDASLVAGTVTIQRAGLSTNADLSSVLTTTNKAPTDSLERSSLLRNMNLDVQVESAPNLVFATNLTNDVQADVGLRIKGTAASPSLLGAVRLNSGEINFYGTKYTLGRGTISFYNPAKIEPVLDFDLATVARGINVNILFSGTLNRLNVSYRSDPPLQTDQILSLLLVGRDPNSNSALISQSANTSNSVFQSGANTLLGQAVSAPLSNRLQRLFGVTRLKIDPQLTGLNNTPQATLTIEQQISRDVTLTYGTNLTRSNQQLVRLQWDLSHSWSIIATRDENGLFAVDCQFRKSYK